MPKHKSARRTRQSLCRPAARGFSLAKISLGDTDMFVLQPLAIQGAGVNLAVGISHMALRPAAR